jgi:hypothetical protein
MQDTQRQQTHDNNRRKDDRYWSHAEMINEDESKEYYYNSIRPKRQQLPYRRYIPFTPPDVRQDIEKNNDEEEGGGGGTRDASHNIVERSSQPPLPSPVCFSSAHQQRRCSSGPADSCPICFECFTDKTKTLPPYNHSHDVIQNQQCRHRICLTCYEQLMTKQFQQQNNDGEDDDEQQQQQLATCPICRGPMNNMFNETKGQKISKRRPPLPQDSTAIEITIYFGAYNSGLYSLFDTFPLLNILLPNVDTNPGFDLICAIGCWCAVALFVAIVLDHYKSSPIQAGTMLIGVSIGVIYWGILMDFVFMNLRACWLIAVLAAYVFGLWALLEFCRRGVHSYKHDLEHQHQLGLVGLSVIAITWSGCWTNLLHFVLRAIAISAFQVIVTFLCSEND